MKTTADTMKSAGYRVFHSKYQCRIPEFAIYSDSVIENFGVITSGDEDLDRSRAKCMSHAIRTIAELAELHANQIPIEVDDDDVGGEMYQLIVAHLNEVKEFRNSNIIGKVPPIEDLVKLDKFAGFIYPRAKINHDDNYEETSELIKFLTQGVIGKAAPDRTKAPDLHKPIVNNTFDMNVLNGKRRW